MKLSIVCICMLFLISCKKDRYVFTMESVQLNSFDKSSYPSQNLSIKIVAQDANTILASTEYYPASYTLPVVFAVEPHPRIHLYKDQISVQLWGDATGFISSSTINMKEYKIIYPIEMETKNEHVSFSVMGSWE